MLDLLDGQDWFLCFGWGIGCVTWRHLRGSKTYLAFTPGLRPGLLMCRPYGAHFCGFASGFAGLIFGLWGWWGRFLSLVRVIGFVTLGHLRGLDARCQLYRGFTHAAIDVPVRWGLFLWLRIRIGWTGRIDFCVWGDGVRRCCDGARGKDGFGS